MKKNRYNKIMENIEVTEEMRDRILNNINNSDLGKASGKAVPFHNYKKYISVAACFVLLLVGSIIIHSIFDVPGEPPLEGEPGISDHGTIGELSETVGFTVKELKDIPFGVDTVRYTSFGADLAEVTYEGHSNTAVFRMAPRKEDVSGDYSEYTGIENRMVNGYSVTMKGNDGKYNLAVWRSDGFSYAVHFAEAVSEQEMLAAVESLQ